MLDTFRENARSWVIQLAIAAIVAVFILSFGAGSRGLRLGLHGTNDWAARVNGREVPANVFQEMYSIQVYRFQQYGMSTPEQLKQMHLREDIMKEIVDEELAAQAAEKSGVYVSNQELFKTVRRGGRFNDPDTKKFDPQRYVDYTERVESSKSFEARIRRSLMAARENELVTEAVPITDDDLKAELLKRDEAAAIAYVKFQPGDFREKVEVTPADIDAQLKSHADDVQKRFNETKSLYTEPRSLKARRLFVPVKQDATADEEKAAKKKIDDARDALKGGKKWEELQPGFAADPTKGDLGWVQLGRSTLGHSTENEIFKLAPGQTSDVVRDRFGFEILQVLEERAPAEKKFDDVKRDIATDLVRESKAKDLARAEAQKTLEALKAGKALVDQWPKQEKPKGEGAEETTVVSDAESKKPHTVVTDEFHPNGGMIPGAGSVPKISAVAFSLSGEKRVPDSVIEEQNSFWVIELKSRKRADMTKLQSDHDALAERVRSAKRDAVRKAWIEKLRAGSKIEENPEFLSYEHRTRSSASEPDES